jgi:hypothetical protein
MKFGLFSSDPRVARSDLEKFAAAYAIQSAQLSSWHETTVDSFTTYDNKSDLQLDECEFEFMTDLAAPDALADHTIGSNGRSRCEVGVSVILDHAGTLLSGPLSISAAASHEYVETKIDPYVCWWCDYSADEEMALEVADPTQGDSYDIDIGGQLVSVSNFVGARYFSIGGPGPYDYMGKITTALTLSPGGYAVLRKGGPGGGFRQIFGEAMPDWMREYKTKHARRIRHLRNRP